MPPAVLRSMSGAILPISSRRDKYRIGAEGLVHRCPRLLLAHSSLGVHSPQQPVLFVHHPTVRLFFQAPIQVSRMLVELHSFGNAIVRPDNGGVTPTVATPDVLPLEHCYVGDAVTRGQVIGSRQSMTTSPDDHNVIGLLRFSPLEPHLGFNKLVHARPPSRSLKSASSGAGTMINVRSDMKYSFTAS